MLRSGDSEFSLIETDRLILRRFQDSDLHNFVAYRAHPDVARYQSWGNNFSLKDGKAFIEEMKSLDPGALGKWFQFAVQLKTSPSLIGDCALHVQEEDSTQAEMGFSFSPEFQGHGYAFEAVNTLLGYAFKRLALSKVFAIIDIENTKSARLLEKAGMARKASPSGNDDYHEYIYTILKTEWTQQP